MGMKKRAISRACLFALALVSGAIGSSAGPLNNLPGRWSGWGTVLFDGGEVEKIKCIATYFLKNGGKDLTQNLRCTTSSSYKISAQSKLTVDGSRLNGSWLEKKSGNEGTVTGRLTLKGFRLSVIGTTFSAVMRVKTSSCNQSVDISPKGLGVKKITISLGKC